MFFWCLRFLSYVKNVKQPQSSLQPIIPSCIAGAWYIQPQSKCGNLCWTTSCSDTEDLDNSLNYMTGANIEMGFNSLYRFQQLCKRLCKEKPLSLPAPRLKRCFQSQSLVLMKNQGTRVTAMQCTGWPCKYCHSKYSVEINLLHFSGRSEV